VSLQEANNAPAENKNATKLRSGAKNSFRSYEAKLQKHFSAASEGVQTAPAPKRIRLQPLHIFGLKPDCF
jgi:hypothetical protein